MAKKEWGSKKKTEDNYSEVSWEIVEELGTISERTENGWAKEVNVVSWNGNTPKVDIRAWNEDHTRCTKGITLNDKEAEVLGIALYKAFK